METNLSKQPGKSKSKSGTAGAGNLEANKTGRSKAGLAASIQGASVRSSSMGEPGATAIDAGGTGGKSKKGVLSKASKVAHSAADTVMHAASEQAHGLTRQVSGLLDDQVAHGADIIREVARTTRRAADDLDGTSPQVASFVRSAADRIDSYAGTIRDQSAEQLFDTASDFTRRQPALVFGLAALAGFLAFRTFKAAPSGYQAQDYRSQRYSGLEGNA